MNKFVMRQAQELQAKLTKAQQELGDMTVTASAGGGVVTVVMDGHQKIRSLKISPEVIDANEIEFLEDLIMAAVNEATQKSQELAAKQLSSLTGGIKIPGLT